MNHHPETASLSPAQDAPEAYLADPTWAATHMAQGDRAKEFLGITIAELARGRAVLSMPVRRDMTNGFGITHGGIVFALADTAFAYACNETASPTVASGADITFARPSSLGDTLTASAKRRWSAGRNGIYDVTVRDQNGEVVAEFRGRAFVTDRPLPEPSTERAS